MIQKLNTPVSVTCTFDAKLKKVFPQEVLWNGRSYLVEKTGLHHTFRKGQTLFHIFSVETPTLFFRLVLNTDNLFWVLEEISDGEPFLIKLTIL